jgi:xylose dehydrogenase (NAD/NADP)
LGSACREPGTDRWFFQATNTLLGRTLFSSFVFLDTTGSLMDVGCYCVNVARTLAGAEPIEVQALASWTETGVDEQLAGTLRFENGLLAQIDCALSLERRQRYSVAGPDGYLDVAAAFVPGTGETTIEEQRGRNEKTTHTINGADQYQFMVEHFPECVAHDTDVRYSAKEAAANMRVIEALYNSARSGGASARPVGDAGT